MTDQTEETWRAHHHQGLSAVQVPAARPSAELNCPRMTNDEQLATVERRLRDDPDNLDLLNKVGVYRLAEEWDGRSLVEAL